MTQQFGDAPLAPIVLNGDAAPAYWAFGNRWEILVDSRKTGGAFSVMEQRMPVGSGPVAHVHPIDEWFYIFEGELELTVGDKTISGKAGDSVWIPRGTAHAFDVRGEAHVLNGYTPGGFEHVIMGIGTPAEHDGLPPAEKPTPQQVDRLYNNYWSTLADSEWSDIVPGR